MSKVVGTLVTLGVIALVAGGVVVGVGYAKTRDEENSEMNKKEYEIENAFENLDIDIVRSNFEIKKSEDGKNRVVCYERENAESKVVAEDNVLKITQRDERAWYKKWFFNWGWITGDEMRVTVYLAGDAYNDLKVESVIGSVNVGSGFTFNSIKAATNTGSVTVNSNSTSYIDLETDTGSIHATDVTATSIKAGSGTGSINLVKVNINGDINVEKHTGSMNIEDSHCDNMYVESTTGSVNVARTTADGNMNIKCSTGSINFENADAANLDLESSTGSIKGSLLTAKDFDADSSTGSINVPKTHEGGKCRVRTSTGSIKLTVVGE